MNEERENDCSASACSAWWIRGTVTIKGTTYQARKHRFLRYVQGHSWGYWQNFCDPKKARQLFEPNDDRTGSPRGATGRENQTNE